MRYFFSLLVLCMSFFSVAQSTEEEMRSMLKLPVERSKVIRNDPEFYKHYLLTTGARLVDEPDKAFRTALELQRLAIKSDKPELLFLADYFLGRCYYFFNDGEKALRCFQLANKTAEAQGWYNEQVKINTFIGSVFQLKRNRQLAEKYYNKSLAIAASHQIIPQLQMETYEKMGYMFLVSAVDSNIIKGGKYFAEGLKLAREHKDTTQIGLFTIKLAQIRFAVREPKEALRQMHEGINFLKIKNDRDQLVIGYKSLGDMFYSLKQSDSALHYYLACYKLRQGMEQNRVTAISATDVAYMYGEMGNLKAMDQYADTAFKYLGLDRSGRASYYVYRWLGEIYDRTHHTEKALAIYKKFSRTLDSSMRADKDEALARQGMQMDFDKQLEEQRLKEEREKAAKEHEQFRSRIYLVGLLLVLVLFVIIFRELRRNKKQKRIIEQQNLEVIDKSRIIEEKNKEMTDSINYAQRIQAGLLSSKENLMGLFPGSFLYYNPKDILSGDFYWYCQKGDQVFIACGDCTGHGVPGALMSVLGINLLTDIIEGKNITEPAEVLNQLREAVIRSLNKDMSRGEYKDGMDIALVRLDRSTGRCTYAGANNPAYHIVNNELKEAYQANKQPVGLSVSYKPFDQQTFEVKKGDFIVLFTDGFPDQFGGPAGKKLMYKPFRALLLSALAENGNCEEILHRKFTEWRGINEQIDDICVMGIRV